MTNFAYFFRHGESAANAGKATTDVSSIDLTPKGVEQAKALARFFPKAPQQVVASPFLRARKTAEHALSAFPSLAIDTWPIQEFTYLSPRKCAGTTPKERLPWVNEYWDIADPEHRAAPEVETFLELISRVDAALAGIYALLEKNRFTAFFGHGTFMNALRWRMGREREQITSVAMRACRKYDLDTPIANGAGFECRLVTGRLQLYDLP